MKLSNYLAQERGRTAALAKAIGAHAPDVSRWGIDPSDKNYRSIPFHYGAEIERVTDGAVSRKDNFENWQKLWPELADAA